MIYARHSVFQETMKEGYSTYFQAFQEFASHCIAVHNHVIVIVDRAFNQRMGLSLTSFRHSCTFYDWPFEKIIHDFSI